MSDFQPAPGYVTIEEEFEARTRKAFTGDRPADFICITSRREAFQLASAEYCVSRGWLHPGEFVQLDEQSSEIRYRPTAVGLARFKETHE